jgi:uncharacterized protein (DUF697 family)
VTVQSAETDIHARAAEIISSAVKWSAAAGAVPVPLLDLVALGVVQAKMVADLSEVYGKPVRSEAARGVVSVLLGTLLPAGATGALFGSGVKMAPVIGSVLGMASMAAFGGAASYAIGKVFVRHFESGGSLADFSADAVRQELQAEFGKAKAKDDPAAGRAA